MLSIAVIGGGAAGFMAAITAKRQMPNARVCIFEKGKKVLAKVAVTGGGRCNITNSFAQVTDLKQAYPRGDKLMKRLFKVFGYQDAYQWFEDNGVKLTTQADQCVFPQSQTSQSVIDCLMGLAQQWGVDIYTEHCVKKITPLENGDIKLYFARQEPLVFNRVAITAGGSPHAEQLQYLSDIGHKIEPPCASLFTFSIKEQRLTALMGTSVAPVYLSIPGTKLRSEGTLLITHWGLSGPSTLKLSSYAARILNECNYQFHVSVNWIHITNTQIVADTLRQTAMANAQKQLHSVRPYMLSARLWNYLIGRARFSAQQKWNELGSKSIHKLTETLTNDTYTVAGKGTWKEEFVTCGGISLKSINLTTLESKACPNLFFAGEVVDVDGITGGFNLQAAWTMGYVAGLNLAKEPSNHQNITNHVNQEMGNIKV